MLSPSRRHPAAALLLLIGLLNAGASFLSAQTVFVCLGGKEKLPPVISIPAPGHGLANSAAAPVPGERWNRIPRTSGVNATDPAATPAGNTDGAKLGIQPLDTATNVALVDPDGNPTKARLGIQIKLATLATDKPRVEPSIHSKSKGAVPRGLMDASWRVFLPNNSLVFTLSGLVPDRRYDLYFYGSCVDMVTNPDGDGEGARFTVAVTNLAAGSSGSVETVGGFCSSIYTFNPETDRMALSPPGTTWATLTAVADSQGQIVFSTAQNSRRRHYVNGFQLVDVGR